MRQQVDETVLRCSGESWPTKGCRANNADSQSERPLNLRERDKVKLPNVNSLTLQNIKDQDLTTDWYHYCYVTVETMWKNTGEGRAILRWILKK